MPRVILVLPDPPLPFGNAAGRWFFTLLHGLVARGHEVTTFASCGRAEDVEAARGLFPAPDFDLRLFERTPDRGLRGKWESLRRPYSYVYSPALRSALADELERGCDVLHLEQLSSGWLGLDRLDRATVMVHFLSEIDISQRAGAPLLERLRLGASIRAERRLLRAYRNVLTLSPRIAEHVRRINPRATTHVVPLGMDLSLYPFEADDQDQAPPTVGLIGTFSWEPTASAAFRLLDRLWPEIRRQVPEARLQFVGRRARATLGPRADVPGVTVDEDVPEIIPYFRSTDVMLYAPGAGSGMKVKVMEAFALGTPVVTNVDGVEGLSAVDGEHAGIAEDDAGLIERTVALLRDPDLRRRRRLAARGLLESQCSPDPVLDRLDRAYAAILGREPMAAR